MSKQIDTGPIYRSLFWLAILAIVGSFCLGVAAWKASLVDGSGQVPCLVKWKIGVLLAWTIIPPMLFWIEYFALWRGKSERFKKPTVTWEEFKYGQDVSSKLWLAVSTALLVLYFGKDIRH